MDQRDCPQTGRSHEPAGSSVISGRVEQLTAKDVMQYGVVSIDKAEPVHKAVSLLLDRNISGLPVTNGGRLEGMLSERDLLRLVYRKEYLPGVVGDYMAHNVTSVDVDDPLSTISKKLVASPFRRVPVLLNRQTLAGMITRTDLIRAYKESFRPSASHSRSGGELLAKDIMRRGLLTLTAEAPLHEAIDLIASQHVTGLVVVDEAMRLVGIITEKDVLSYCTHPFPEDCTVAAFMTTNVIAFDCDAGLDQICECLIEKDFHRVPIVDGGRLVGVISRSDILRSRATTLTQPSTHLPGRAGRMPLT